MELPSYFSDFLSAIRPTDSQMNDSRNGHKTLRDRLEADESLKDVIVSTFLQGSYRRATAIRPTGDQRADVDVIVVTSLNTSMTPDSVVEVFLPFLEKHYKGKYKVQSRSIAIELSNVDLDIVPTAAPSEQQRALLKLDAIRSYETPEEVDDWKLVKSWIPPALRGTEAYWLDAMKREAEWKSEPLLIPDRDLKKWEKTHPIAQMQWTWAKNRSCKSHYVNVVKAVKWWHREQHPENKYPKGYPLEHIVGYCCPDSIGSVAEGVTRAFENIVSNFANAAASKTTPFLRDYGVPENNVLHRLSAPDFGKFYNNCRVAARIARQALDETDKANSATLWRKLFGEKFPAPEPSGDDSGGKTSGGFTPRAAVTTISGGRFA